MIGTLDIAKVLDGIEQIYSQECLAIDAAMTRTVNAVLELHRSLAISFNQATSQSLSQSSLTSDSQKTEKLRSALLREILLSGQSLALKMETVIEANLMEEIERLSIFALTVDRVYDHLVTTLLARGEMGTATTKSSSSPMLEIIKAHQAIHNISAEQTSSEDELSPFSAYGVGALTSLLTVFNLYRKLADLNFEVETKPDESSYMNALSARIGTEIMETLQAEHSARTEGLITFVEIKFAELKNKIELLLNELRQRLVKPQAAFDRNI